MPLTPSKADPNQANELRRRMNDAGSFGVTTGFNAKGRKSDTQQRLEQIGLQHVGPDTLNQLKRNQ